MTDREKDSVSRMRRRGFGYTDIARALNIPEGTVKTYCKRNCLQDADLGETHEAWRDFSVPLECKQCGKPLTQGEKHKPRSFCSDACRLAWWNSHRSEVRRKGAHIMTCAICGEAFSSYDPNRKFCSTSCYVNPVLEATGMTSEQLKRELDYRLAMALARSLLRESVVDEADYRAIDARMISIFQPVLAGLYPENNLIQSETRSNM